MRQPLEERVKTAGALVVRTEIFCGLWDLYQGPNRKRNLPALNKFPEFLRFDEHAHRVAFFVHAAALYDRTRNTINLPQLAKDVHEGSRIGDREMKDIEERLASVDHVIKGVRIIRNNALAHRSDSVSFDEAFRRAKLSMNDLRNLLVVSLAIANALLVSCGCAEVEFWTLALEDAEGFIDVLSASE